ncbi:DUF427 domain-containing protein [Aureimonas fodinaquatilis]|uniref:DUF427 domain-containing protein n=1 Tax=Aureimonas fodinaquatilis TaxID=2565783 RepID=A0A5B0DZH1_9HYPH|nr:DUF427 domain-containing protein [Aureimonas fodinaquatilis]KAA0970609.1 DUF427 domain-containing protein [Aureimonas fodinaquatilis]
MDRDQLRIEVEHRPVVVKHHDAVIASSEHALLVHGQRETPIYYLPSADVYFEQMARTDAVEDFQYYSVTASGGGVERAAWLVADGCGATLRLVDYVGFDPDKLHIIAG